MTGSDERILYLKRSDVETAAACVDAVEAMRDVFALHGSGETVLPDEAYLGWRPTPGGPAVRSLSLPAFVGGTRRAAGTKIINSNPDNPNRGIPRASGVTLLYDPDTTRTICIMEGAFLSSLRTAAVTGLAVDLAATATVNTLGVIGAGVLAEAHIRLLAGRLGGLRSVLVYDHVPERATALCARLAPALSDRGVAISVVDSAEACVRPSEVIVPATTTTTGYISYEWLQRGATVVNVSLDDVLPDVVFHADAVVVDDWRLVSGDSRRLLGRMYRSGEVIGPHDDPPSNARDYRRVDAELSDLVAGRFQARRSPDDIVLVNPFGLAIDDVMLASRVYDQARAMELGQFLEV